MDWHLEVEILAGYIKIKIFGEREEETLIDEAIHVYKLADELCEINDKDRILLELHLRGRIPYEISYKFVNFISKHNWRRLHKVATYDINFGSYIDNKFTEVAAEYRGFKYRTFINEDDAIKWLINN